MKKVQPFHIAIPVHDVAVCTQFYTEILECKMGRYTETWVDLDLFGHQLVIHYKPGSRAESLHTNPVDGKNVPVPHYGVVLEWDHFFEFSEMLKTKGVEFVISPYIRFKGDIGEQATLFFLDPSGNALEFKSFKDPSQLFAS